MAKEQLNDSTLIRVLTRADNSKIAKIIRSVLEEHGVNKPGTVYTDPTTDDLFALFQNEKSVYYIAEKNGVMVGGCGIYPTQGLPEGCVELVKLYLMKEVRGTGLGKRLMETCLNTAKEWGYTSVYLESMPELNSAIGLYQSLGFESLTNPLGASGHFACDVWMEKKIG